MHKKKPQPNIELPQSRSEETRILMTWVERSEDGRARVHVVVEEQFEVEDSYEAVQALLRDKKESAIKLI